MRVFISLFLQLLIALPLTALAADAVMNTTTANEDNTAITEARKAKVNKDYGKLPLYFIENKGQVDGRVKFYEKGRGHATFFTDKGVVFSLSKSDGKTEKSVKTGVFEVMKDNKDLKHTTEALTLSFIGANKNTEITSSGKMDGRVNYFVGSDRSEWRSNIAAYEAVTYNDVYKNIDIKFYGNNRNMEHDVIVHPGGDFSEVIFAYGGIKGLKVTEAGNLEVWLNHGKLIQQKPIIYQEIQGERVAVAGSYRILNGEDGLFRYGFNVTSYDRTKALVIDPVLEYSTYLGGFDSDAGSGIIVDAFGAVYVTGYTSSTDFPLLTPIQGAIGGGSNGDAFVTKLNAAGTAFVYSTYIGGSGNDQGVDIAVDGTGAVYVAGATSSLDFPLAGSIQGVYGGGVNDAFVIKINPAGSAVIYSTYIGGSGGDSSSSIAIDSSGAVYVAGHTSSPDFPLMSPVQGALLGLGDAFAAKINPAGTAYVYSTYLGGTGNDVGAGIALDSSGAAYLAGYTWSADFPLAAPIQAVYGGGGVWGGDAFITKINPAGTLLTYSTYLGGSSDDYALGIAVNNANEAYVTGYTSSSDFPLKNPIQGALVGVQTDAFITKVNAAGTAYVYSTYLGGRLRDDLAFSVVVDSSGAAYVTGYTGAADFPVLNPIQGVCGDLVTCSDAFITKIHPTGTALIYSTYLGGGGFDSGGDIAVDGVGTVYVTGMTQSPDFPLMNPVQGTGTTGITLDAFITKISDTTLPPPLVTLVMTPDFVVTTKGGILGYNVTATNTSAVRQCFDYWENVTLPNSTIYPPTGSLFGVVHLCLNAEASRSAHLVRDVPLGAPLGSYILHAFVGTHPGVVLDEAAFNFDVNP